MMALLPHEKDSLHHSPQTLVFGRKRFSAWLTAASPMLMNHRRICPGKVCPGLPTEGWWCWSREQGVVRLSIYALDISRKASGGKGSVSVYQDDRSTMGAGRKPSSDAAPGWVPASEPSHTFALVA